MYFHSQQVITLQMRIKNKCGILKKYKAPIDLKLKKLITVNLPVLPAKLTLQYAYISN